MNKIVFVTRSMSAGGAERVIAELVKYFVNSNIHCSIIMINNEEVFYQLPQQVELYSIGKISNKKYLDKIYRYKKVRHLIRNIKPDVVLALPEDIGIYVIPALLCTNIPVVVSERNNPWVMPWKKETRILRKLAYPFANGFVFQTTQAASFFPKYIQDKGTVLPNPLDLGRIPSPYYGERHKEIVGVGRLDSQKNFPLLIEAFTKFYQKHTDYRLVIYGEGKLRKELEDLAESLLPMDAYSFPGKTNQLLEKINQATMFVLSSDYEGMPNVVIEAMAMGIPVISTDCPSGGSAELIENGKSGLLVPVGDVDKMYQAMCLIADDNNFAEKISNNAIKIKQQLDASIIAEKWRSFLDGVSRKG